MVVIKVDLKSSSTICDTGNLLSVTFKPALSPSLLCDELWKGGGRIPTRRPKIKYEYELLKVSLPSLGCTNQNTVPVVGVM